VILTVGLLYYIRKHYREALEPTSDLYWISLEK
jgi:hypothetical protein